MAKINDPVELAAMVKRADELQNKLEALTDRAATERPVKTRDAVVSDTFTAVPDASLYTTRQSLTILEQREKQLHRAIKNGEAQLKTELDCGRKARLAQTIQNAKDGLTEITISKVTARSLSVSELAETSSRLRKELQEALAKNDTALANEIRAKQAEIARDRSRRNGIRMAL